MSSKSSLQLQVPSTKAVVSAAASVAATTMLIRTFARDLIPRDLQHYLFFKLRKILSSFSSQIVVVIEEFDGLNANQLYSAADTYLGTIISPTTHRFRVTLPQKETKIFLALDKNQEINDSFKGVSLKWRMVSKQVQSKYVSGPDDYHQVAKTDLRYFQLSFHKKHKQVVVEDYLPFLLEKAKALKEKRKTLKIFTLRFERIHGSGKNPWQSVNLDHPATFDTLAMDLDMKRAIMDDLDRFVKRKEYYRRVGKAWKRGYLLFGPPGTGKSSLIAAMANYLHFNVYDLELTDIRSNSELRRLLISTANRSILVVEDIDCSIELQDRLAKARAVDPHAHRYGQGNQVTLSGLLNFIDGLWSSCGDERIIVFTTNHKERLDPALLRPGRMDVHIHMSYCTPCGFKMLASSYLEITEHPLFSEVEQLIETTKVTPAEVGEQLMKDEEAEVALRGLIEFLQRKKEGDKIKPQEVGSSALLKDDTQELKGENVESEKQDGEKS